MQNFPNEILYLIFSFLQSETDTSPHNPSSNLLHIALTCRRWHELVNPRIWEHVILTNYNVHKFANSIKVGSSRSSPYSNTRSISLRFHLDCFLNAAGRAALRGDTPRNPEDPDWLLPQIAWNTGWASLLRAFVRLTDQLASFKHNCTGVLKSVSLRFMRRTKPGTTIANDDGRLVWVPSRLIGDFIRSLPESIESLEVDTQGLDDQPGAPEHLCLTLKERLKQLKNLRLQLRWMCADLLPCLPQNAHAESTERSAKIQNTVPQAFTSPPLHLQTLVLNLWNPWDPTLPCRPAASPSASILLQRCDPPSTTTLINSAPLSGTFPLPDRLALKNHALQTSLVTALSDLLHAHALPSISTLLLVNKVSARSYVSYFLRLDFLAQRVNFLPSSFILSTSRSFLADTYLRPFHTVYSLRPSVEEPEVVVFGALEELGQFVEVDAWVEAVFVPVSSTTSPGKNSSTKDKFFAKWGDNFEQLEKMEVNAWHTTTTWASIKECMPVGKDGVTIDVLP